MQDRRIEKLGEDMDNIIDEVRKNAAKPNRDLTDNELQAVKEMQRTSQLKIVAVTICVLWFILIGGCTAINL